MQFKFPSAPTGRASRVCVAADTWGEPDVSECEELNGLQESVSVPRDCGMQVH